ncbi:hypothetical protein ZWY2020_029704 [Hordeum vulgare]|nr:hypothetical protein ZWY2020_029704 [Hordeum vulgare]
METLMVDRVHSSLRLFMNRDAVFLCERLCPPPPRNTPSRPPRPPPLTPPFSTRSEPTPLRRRNLRQDETDLMGLLQFVMGDMVTELDEAEVRDAENATEQREACNVADDEGLVNALKLIEAIKDKYIGVTYADLFQLASATAVEEAGGPKIPMIYGRVDVSAPEQCPPEGRLPVLHDIDLYIM